MSPIRNIERTTNNTTERNAKHDGDQRFVTYRHDLPRMSVALSSDHSGSLILSQDLRETQDILQACLRILNQIHEPSSDRYLVPLVIIELDHSSFRSKYIYYLQII